MFISLGGDRSFLAGHEIIASELLGWNATDYLAGATDVPLGAHGTRRTRQRATRFRRPHALGGYAESETVKSALRLDISNPLS